MSFDKLIDLFDRVYIVNLPSRRDRRVETIAEFLRFGVMVPSEQVCFFEATRPKEKEGFPSIGALGNLISQTRVMKDAIDRGLSRILICEDDLSLNQVSAADFSEIINGINSDCWGIASLGYLYPESPSVDLRGILPWAGPTRGTHMYAVQGPAIKAFHDYLEVVRVRPAGHPNGGAMFFDGAFNMVRDQVPEIKFYLAVPCLSGQRSSRTDLHDLRIYDRVDFLRPVINYLRAIKNKRRLRSNKV